MTRNSPSLWSGGVEWGPAATEGATAYWQGADEPGAFTGRAVPAIAINGQRITAQMSRANWTLGRTDWLSTLAPCAASFSFVGAVAAAPNDLVIVTVEVDATQAGEHTDPLWMGRVDTYTEVQAVDGSIEATVSCTDVIGALGESKAPTSIAAGYKLDTLTEYLGTRAGIPIEVETTGTLVSFLADADVTGTTLALINRAERSSNALLFLQGNGKLRAVVREAIAGSIETIPLAGYDAVATWATALSLANVVTRWWFADEAETWSQGNIVEFGPYGERSYEVLDMMTADADHYDPLILSAAMEEPRRVVTMGTFPTPDLASNVLWLDPLDWVAKGAETWQVMEVRHEVSLSEWLVTIAADQTQNYITDAVDPTPVDPDPTPGTTTITNSYTSTKSAVVYKSSGGDYYGNGADDYLSVGYYAGTRTRSLISFTIPWGTDFPGFQRVKSAVLELDTTTQVRVAFGSHPSYYVKRVTESWSEGSVSYPNSAANAVVWPGPSATSSGQQHKTHGDSTNTERTITITAIVEAAKAAGGNDVSVRLQSANEDSSSATIEFYSDDYATSGKRPRLIVTCEVI